MEHLREVKITLYIDTNKQTIREEFESLEDLRDFIKNSQEWIEWPREEEEDDA